MPKGSAAYRNMRRALFEAVRRIPRGLVVETARLAEALNIPARHAAFILSQMTAEEAEAIPRHRVVPTGGDLGRGAARRAQLALLRAEGHNVKQDRYVVLDRDVLWTPDDRHRGTIWADVEDGDV